MKTVNFQPLYTTARVMGAIYKIASTAILLAYLTRRVSQGRRIKRSGLRQRAMQEFIDN